MLSEGAELQAPTKSVEGGFRVRWQNRELTIQNALERVRSQASAMQASDELSEVTSDEEIPTRTGVFKVGTRSAGEGRECHFFSAMRTSAQVLTPHHNPKGTRG